MRRLAHLLLCLIPAAANAGSPVTSSPSSGCETAARSAEQAARLPQGVLTAIAQVESGRPEPRTGRLHPWPWTINAEGVGQFFASKAQAIAAVQTLQARGVHSIDVGCMQVNLMFHPNAFASLDRAFDPQENARYAARFLNTLYAERGDWLRAVSAYHSSTPTLGADYRRRVLALWRAPNLAGWGLGLAVAYRSFLPPDRVYADFAPSAHVYGAFAGSSR